MRWIRPMPPLTDVSNASLILRNPSLANNPSNVTFSTYQRNSVIATALAGLISCTLVSVLLLYITISAFLFWRRQVPGSSAPFLRRQVMVFVVCLLVADLIQSLSGVLQVKWAMENRVHESVACIAQAVALTMGDLGSTVWSCVIAAHTFSGIALGKQWSRSAICTIVVVGWFFVVALTIIGPTALQSPTRGPFYGIAGDWCFITSAYAIDRLVIHYVPLFIAAVLIPVLYGLVFLVLRGSINFKPQHGSPTCLDNAILRERIVIGKRMLWYPVAYLTCITPITIIRMFGLRDDHIPDGVLIFGVFVLFLLGAIDSIIYTTTRKLVKPVRFSVPLRRFNGERGPTPPTDNYPVTSSRKLGFSQVGSADLDHTLHMPSFVRYDEEHAQKICDPPTEHEKLHVAAVHVTLERIEEIR